MSLIYENKGTPLGTATTLVLSDTSQTLSPPAGSTYAVVQVQKNNQPYADDRMVALYNVDGNFAKIGSSFSLGHGDYRIFEKGELKKGVSFVSAEIGLTGLVVIQYYED